MTAGNLEGVKTVKIYEKECTNFTFPEIMGHDETVHNNIYINL